MMKLSRFERWCSNKKTSVSATCYSS